MTTTPTIAILGAGNMGSSLIGGLIQNGHPSHSLWASDPSTEKLNELERLFNIHTTIDNAQAADAANVIVFAVKPQLLQSVTHSLASIIKNKKPLVLSVAAGIRISSIEHWLQTPAAIVRAMPNTPALISCGATALYANSHVNHEQHNMAESILRSVGVVVWLPNEQLMDAVTALSGSGPAYFFLMMEILQEVAEQLGLDKEVARLLTLQTALGAARMAIESGKPLDQLRQHVTSPGGTTEKALSVLEARNIREIFQAALLAAKQRSEELAVVMDRRE
jgi:pyrroline-5-carboxylate reductase